MRRSESQEWGVPGDAGTGSGEVLQCGAICADLDAYEVTVDGEPVQVYLREFEILVLLLRHPNRVLASRGDHCGRLGRGGRGGTDERLTSTFGGCGRIWVAARARGARS
ncbi:MAG: hypothetical protein KatS3mg077_2157 [Candidatus Binatia bacterium]|nr:MAG: hypothetical protein KatS3mg077_2157 [Candidatus Binatia bacterium]